MGFWKSLVLNGVQDRRGMKDRAEAIRADPLDDRIGKTIDDRYEIRGFIGDGGLSRVYLAHDRQNNERAAMKFARENGISLELSELFLEKEIVAMRRLSHPNIVDFKGSGTHDLRIYLIMEYVEGKSLSDIIERDGHVTWKRARETTLQICDALSEIHSKGMIHGDVKPGNVVLVRRGGKPIAKLFDFGFSRFLDGTMDPTPKGFASCTAGYVAPEILYEDPLDQRVDVFSLGVTIYRTLSGKPPFDGKDRLQTARAVLRDQPPPLRGHDACRDMPVRLERAVMRAIEKEPDKRFADISEFKAELEKA